jgi:hypothetical protein
LICFVFWAPFCSIPHAADLCFSPSLLEPSNLNGVLAHFEGQPPSAALSSAEQPSLGALIALIRLTCNCMVDMFKDLKDVREPPCVCVLTDIVFGTTSCRFSCMRAHAEFKLVFLDFASLLAI